MRRIKMPQQDFVLKTHGGGLCARGGGGVYLQDTTVYNHNYTYKRTKLFDLYSESMYFKFGKQAC